MFLVLSFVRDQNPVLFHDAWIEPYDTTLCPNQPLEYHTELDSRGEFDIEVWQSVRRVKSSEAGSVTVDILDDLNFSIETTDRFDTDRVIPLNYVYPPGDYYLLVSVRIAGHHASARQRIPFEMLPHSHEECRDEPA